MGAPSTCSKLLSVPSLTSDIALQFVGAEGEYDYMYDQLYKINSANILGKAHNIYSWYKVLRVVNKLYIDEPEAPQFAQFLLRYRLGLYRLYVRCIPKGIEG